MNNLVPNVIKVIKKKTEKIENPIDENSRDKIIQSRSDGTNSMVIDSESNCEMHEMNVPICEMNKEENKIHNNLSIANTTESKIQISNNLSNIKNDLNHQQPQKRRIQPTFLK